MKIFRSAWSTAFCSQGLFLVLFYLGRAEPHVMSTISYIIKVVRLSVTGGQRKQTWPQHTRCYITGCWALKARNRQSVSASQSTTYKCKHLGSWTDCTKPGNNGHLQNLLPLWWLVLMNLAVKLTAGLYVYFASCLRKSCERQWANQRVFWGVD